MNQTYRYPIKRVLIANRGEIAVRCAAAIARAGLESVGIYTKSDSASKHTKIVDFAVELEGFDDNRDYIDTDQILRICASLDVDAVIPGYGFLSEDASFARRVQLADMTWVGPDVAVIESMGLKHRAREIAIAAGVPVIPGTALLSTLEEALRCSDSVGFPIMLKASSGGGGMGMQICRDLAELREAFQSVRKRSEALYNSSSVFLERYIPEGHHIEVQVFGNGKRAVHFGERECSIQRRHQKVIEECPSPMVAVWPRLRERLTSCAVALAESIGYGSAGTVEFLVDDITGDFFFLEMNTRLQVEHGITELCYQVDLVVLMLEQAQMQAEGKRLPTPKLLALQKDGPVGAAIECRLYAENPGMGFAPSSGTLQKVDWATVAGARVDTWVATGTQIVPHYDPLLAKIMVHAIGRSEARRKMLDMLEQSDVNGPPNNKSFLHGIIESEAFSGGRTLTTFLTEQYVHRPCGFSVLSAGASTTVQDLSARTLKGKGIPRSGPMDPLSSQISNALVGNPASTETLEITLTGPKLLFKCAAIFAVCGGQFPVAIDGSSVPMWARLYVEAGSTLEIGALSGPGCRCYLAIRGGLPQVASWLGSKSTTPSLKFGGHQGRQLVAGDFLEIFEAPRREELYYLPLNCTPSMDIKSVCVMRGPHDTDELMLPEDRNMIYTSTWKVANNFSRTGIRLIGPRPRWARQDGGQGGSHPSNIVDYPYPSPGGINWTGDTPVIFPMDGPGSGGFLCSSTVISAELWKLGQLKPGDEILLQLVTYATATSIKRQQAMLMADIQRIIDDEAAPSTFDLDIKYEVGGSEPVLAVLEGKALDFSMTIRQCGDCFVLVEIGQQTMTATSAVQALSLARAIEAQNVLSVAIQVNVSSVCIEYDLNEIEQDKLVELIKKVQEVFGLQMVKAFPCRELRLPLVFDHPALNGAIDKYIATQRSHASYLPDNIEHVRQVNGLGSREAVLEAMLQTQYLVVSVGFMAGLPLLLPLDPRSRLTAQKYNPSRLFTPKGAVGMGGSLFTIYPMDQPGGYMLLALTLPVWDTFATKPGHETHKPWLCEHFDLVRFEQVGLDQFEKFSSAWEKGQYQFDIREANFDFEEHLRHTHAPRMVEETCHFLSRQKESVEKARLLEEESYAEWSAQQAKKDEVYDQASIDEIEGTTPIYAPVAGSIWKLNVVPGDMVEDGQELFVLEAMKMEIAIRAGPEHAKMKVASTYGKVGTKVALGTTVVSLEPSL